MTAKNDRPIVSVCMHCHRVIGPDNRPTGIYLASKSIVSHGVCLTCAPAYCAQLGLSAQDTARILAAGQTRNTLAAPKSDAGGQHASRL